ncbi:dihydroxyacetone phosphate acyltransferase [Cynoglossus semilaevis]|uniref:dihydroxyacetone phosphate acyltransferase n=1 Tax=Cynoglossus semilaevis TaxID=244447 RepID=UPI0004983CBE|nr:dihydroxyacetone phosphate acyltransferase-like [Cynoglossus semilaevis]
MTHRFSSSGRPDWNHDEEFVDILEDRRHSSDLGHALRTFNPQPYQGGQPCSAAELTKTVLESQHLCYVAREIALETGSSIEEVTEEARRTLDEMSQNLQLGFIRLMSFTLTKVFKKLFSSIFVNMDTLSTLQQSIQQTPVILMPNHRSYVDFLVISYIMFSYDLPIPVIAAGIPLAGMKMVGEILRRSGAFFIRRAIGSDKLYWAVLSEYVKTIVRKGHAPLEFYVEGLRSRTLKSITPKLGMMHMVLEPYLKGQVFDITLVPVSISYDRVLEESLLSHELLGVPKPKESTTGLLKASSVLQDSYGAMHVNFGHPLSVRELLKGKINRCQYNFVPRDLPQKPSAEVQACVSWLAHVVVGTQEQGSVISPWSLMTCLLLQAPITVLTVEGFPWHQLTEKTLWLKRLVLNYGVRLNWSGQTSDSDVMSSSLTLHRSVVQRKADRVYLVREKNEPRRRPVSEEASVTATAKSVLMLAAYRNQSMHVFVRPALLAVALNITRSTQKNELFAFFCFLQSLFSYEFIFIPGMQFEDFEDACLLLKKCGAIRINSDEVIVSDSGQEILSFHQSLIQPFIDSYQVTFSSLSEQEPDVFTDKQFLPAVRNLATRLLLSGEVHTYEALSSDTQKNSLSALQRLEAVRKLRASENSEYKVDKAAVKHLADRLSGRVPAQALHTPPNSRL